MAKKLVCVDVWGKRHEVPVDQLSWLPGIYAIVIHNDAILLSKQHGKHVLPGGSAEFGESLERVVIRETEEETGIEVKNPSLLTVKSNLFVMPGIDKPVQSLQVFYACEYADGELSVDGLDEYEKTWSGEPEWVPLNKFDELVLGSSFEWRDIVNAYLLLRSTEDRPLVRLQPNAL